MDEEKKHILYVDDDKNMLEIAKAALEATGRFRVETSTDAKKSVLALQNTMPDLIILDVIMPDMSGMAAFELIRSLPHLDATPVIFITTKASYSDLESYKSLGKTSVIVKPFDPEDLPFQVDLFLNRLAS